ncbi:MAG: AAA family ATPase [Planctomycetes bacterium]|nr:AAA family ATPase [Planctomycetota bacterium]
MLNNISVENFRGVKKAQIDDFKNINLFIGKNGCGKSTVLEIIFLLCSACEYCRIEKQVYKSV